MDLQKVDGIIEKYGSTPNTLIEVLLDVQEECRYLPEEALVRISEHLNISLSRIYHVATFFKAFSLIPRGKYCISVCLGTACHVGGGVKILEKLERDLSVPRGGTSADMNFSLDEVHCLGCCGLAPVVTVNEDLYGKVTPSKIPGIMKKYTK
jgi:NADH-quinone oxidoreductase subunit E